MTLEGSLQLSLIIAGLIGLATDLVLLYLAILDLRDTKKGSWERIAARGMIRRTSVKGLLLAAVLYELLHNDVSMLLQSAFLLRCVDLIASFGDVKRIGRIRDSKLNYVVPEIVG